MFEELTSKRCRIPALSVGLSPSQFITWNAVGLYLGGFGKAQIPCAPFERRLSWHWVPQGGWYHSYIGRFAGLRAYASEIKPLQRHTCLPDIHSFEVEILYVLFDVLECLI